MWPHIKNTYFVKLWRPPEHTLHPVRQIDTNCSPIFPTGGCTVVCEQLVSITHLTCCAPGTCTVLPVLRTTGTPVLPVVVQVL